MHKMMTAARALIHPAEQSPEAQRQAATLEAHDLGVALAAAVLAGEEIRLPSDLLERAERLASAIVRIPAA